MYKVTTYSVHTKLVNKVIRMQCTVCIMLKHKVLCSRKLQMFKFFTLLRSFTSLRIKFITFQYQTFFCQRFRFCGDLDCPDWILAEINTLARMVSSLLFFIVTSGMCNILIYSILEVSCFLEALSLYTAITFIV